MVTQIQSAKDRQIGGDHYKNYKIQPVEFIVQNNIPFLEGSVIKYVCRHGNKNGLEDILKAIHYLELLIEERYKEEIQEKLDKEIRDNSDRPDNYTG